MNNVGSVRVVCAILTFVAISLPDAHAVYPSDDDQFRRVMCEGELLPNLFQNTENFRRDLNMKISGHFATLQATREAATENFLSEINRRPDLPSLRNITLQSLLAVDDERNYEAADRFNRGLYWQSLIDDAKREVAKDPYIAWLNKRSGSLEPAKMLFNQMNHDGPTAVPGDVALVRVIRDLDPFTTIAQRKTVDAILEMRAKEVLFIDDLAPAFRDRGRLNLAWNLAPDLRTARQNHHRLLRIIRTKYGRLHGRSEFERTGAAQKAYEMFLLENYGSSVDLDLYGRALAGLRLIIEVAEASAHYDFFSEYLSERAGD